MYVEGMKISTLNVRSMANCNKRRSLFEWFMKSHNGILFIQETHSCENTIEQWCKEWQCKFYCSHGTTNSRGVAIMIPNSIDHTVINQFKDENGRIIGVECELKNEKIVFINCYFPTKDKQNDQLLTLRLLQEYLLPYADHSIVLGGDFNLTLDPSLDKQGGTSAFAESTKFRQEIIAFLEAFALSDCLRIKNIGKKLFTWYSKHLKVRSRLDYIFVSEQLLNRLTLCNKKLAILTDHYMVQITLQTEFSTRGKGYWKFNTSLLKDKDYIKLVKRSITKTVENNKESNRSMLWDIIKMNIRGETITFCSYKKRERQKHENELLQEIEILENEDETDENIEKLAILRASLEDYLKLKVEGAAIRARVEWVEEGEKNSKFFLNLEKHRSQNKTISQLKLANGDILTESSDILNEQYRFYNELYSLHIENEKHTAEAEDIFLKNNVPQLTDEDIKHCEGAITYSECTRALKDMKNNKTPGSDGFSVEFYKFFWKDISEHLINSLNFAFEKGEISIDQKRGLISLIPKKDKDRILLKNWRPIALLNTDYKILAKSLATRLKQVIGKIVDTDQTGYIKGRYIGENIRTVTDVIHYLSKKNLNGIILLIDFQKAFDSVSWRFIDKTLQKFNFGCQFRRWVNVLYNNSESSVLNNGHFTKFFKPSRGVRQGCPLSAYLFLLVVELLAVEIRSNKAIEGISIKNSELKISQMADDTTVFLKSEVSISQLLKTLKQFAICSGLYTNVEKTKAYHYGINKPSINKFNLEWETEPISFLGITITSDAKENIEKNFLPKIKLMENLLKIWSLRNLSLKGKIVLINALIVSLFVYPAMIIGIPDDTLKTIDRAIFNFLWSSKQPKIAQKVIQNNIHEGGLKMPNIFAKEKAWKLTWFKRAVQQNSDAKWILLLDSILEDITFCHLMNSNIEKQNMYIDRLPTFYQEIFKTWFKIYQNNPVNTADVQNQMLWLNKEITVNKKPILWNEWYRKGIVYIYDIVDKNSEFYTAEQLFKIYGIKCNFLQILQIRQSIPYKWRQMLADAKEVIKYKEINLFIISNNTNCTLKKTTSSIFYWMLMGKQVNTPSCIAKWREIWNISDLEWKDIFSRHFKICHEAYLQTFQYKILHRIIPCNHWLFNIKVKSSPNCTLCNVDDNITH